MVRHGVQQLAYLAPDSADEDHIRSRPPLNLPVTMGSGARAKSTSLSLCLVDVELDDGRIGTGMAAITEEEVVASWQS